MRRLGSTQPALQDPRNLQNKRVSAPATAAPIPSRFQNGIQNALRFTEICLLLSPALCEPKITSVHRHGTQIGDVCVCCADDGT